MSRALEKLQTWYRAQCDGDWERSFGVLIGTLDNPGWIVKIDLSETLLADQDFDEIREADASGKRWILCRIVGSQFEGTGDPARLEEIIGHFVAWAEGRPEWLSVPPDTTQEDLDQEFWIALGDEVGPEGCRREGCDRRRITQSVLCRPHHYKMIKGVPCPFEKTIGYSDVESEL